jgi:uncharacterized protein YbaA (DUF1428 family)
LTARRRLVQEGPLGRGACAPGRKGALVKYVDGYVIAIPKKNLPAYTKMAKKAGALWREHGAIDYKECVGEDMKPGFGVPFPNVAKTKAGETVMFSFVVFKSRQHRDKVNAKVMKDPRLQEMCDPKNMPFDMKKMAYGGFEVLVDA